MKGGEVSSTPVQAARGRRLLIGCSGRKSITKDVIANLEHGTYIASGSSDLVEIDREYLDDQMIRSRRLGMGDRDWEPGRLWAGTEHLLPGKPNKEIYLLADGYPVTVWIWPQKLLDGSVLNTSKPAESRKTDFKEGSRLPRAKRNQREAK